MNFDVAAVIEPPFFTADLPGIGGRVKSIPEDFDVEEIPAYEPSGSGDFLYLWLEKRGLGAEYFTRQVAHRLGIAAGDVGAAGLKDRHAVTRQWISVPAAVEGRVGQLDGDGIRVLRVGRHGNKLRAGHLRGNRFRIVIRDLGAPQAAIARVAAVVERLHRDGLPNFYGPQRFGRDGETLELGLSLLASATPSNPAANAAGRDEGGRRRSSVRSPFLRKLALSAVQSALFNQYLARRLADGMLQRVLLGDVMAKWPAGGMFTAEDVAAEQARFDRREIVSAGPIFGRKTFPAKHEAAAREATLLAAAGLSRESFAGFGKLLMGSRRHNLVYIDDLAAEWNRPSAAASDSVPGGLPHGELQLASLQLTFSLPAGSYATVLLREVMKVSLTTDDAPADD